MDIHEQAITIQKVSQKLDVPKPTLRFWEREFDGILVPLRTNGGQRRYAPEHISVIEEIKMLKKAGVEPSRNQEKAGEGAEVGSQMSEIRKYVKSRGADVRIRKSKVPGWTNGGI